MHTLVEGFQGAIRLPDMSFKVAVGSGHMSAYAVNNTSAAGLAIYSGSLGSSRHWGCNPWFQTLVAFEAFVIGVQDLTQKLR